jgi:hypothetical protein
VSLKPVSPSSLPCSSVLLFFRPLILTLYPTTFYPISVSLPFAILTFKLPTSPSPTFPHPTTSPLYPTGNYVSNWHWQDCVGPIADRPKRIELAWLSEESNHFGLNEFVDYAKGLGVEP